MSVFGRDGSLSLGDAQADRIVPPTGYTVRLTIFTSAAMAFLAVFALALSFATGRLADRWSDELSRSATLRISAPASELPAQTQAALRVLETTQGVSGARALTLEEQRELLDPWFGPDLPLDRLPLPQIIEIDADPNSFDALGLRNRLAGEVPGAVLEDHARWRAPLVGAADSLRRLGLISVLLIAGSLAALITLAAQAALSANAQVISVMRLVGAEDGYIAGAFVRRFTLRALLGAIVGTGLGLLAVWMLPGASEEGSFLTGLGFQGSGWFIPWVIPPLAAVVAFVATRVAASRTLRSLT